MKKGLDASQKKYEKYAVMSVCVGRLIPLCRTYISFIAGISRQNFLSYLGATAIGVTIWNSVLIGLGYIFAENWNIVTGYYNEYKTILIPVLALLVVFLIFRRFWKRKKGKNSSFDGVEE